MMLFHPELGVRCVRLVKLPGDRLELLVGTERATLTMSEWSQLIAAPDRVASFGSTDEPGLTCVPE